MRRKAKNLIACEHFTWSLFTREGVFYADGRHNRPNVGKHSLNTRDEKSARENVRKLDSCKAMELGIVAPVAPASPVGIDIAEGWRLYLEQASKPAVLGGVGPSTLKRYKAVQDKHVCFCEKRDIINWTQVTKQHIIDYGNHLHQKGYAPASTYLECTTLKQVIKRFIEEFKLLPESARVYLPLSRSEESDTYCFSREEVLAMLERCTAPKLRWLGDVIIALALTGMRIGELAVLRWNAVELDANVITVVDNRHSAKAKAAGAVQTTKGRRTRRLPILPGLADVLKRLPRRSDGRVFSGYKGGVLDPDKVLRTLKTRIIASLTTRFPTPPGQIGFKDAVVHSFRHYFVSEAFRAGVTEAEIMSWVGHRDSRIVRRYRHARPESATHILHKIDISTSTVASDVRKEAIDTTTSNPVSPIIGDVPRQ